MLYLTIYMFIGFVMTLITIITDEKIQTGLRTAYEKLGAEFNKIDLFVSVIIVALMAIIVVPVCALYGIIKK